MKILWMTWKDRQHPLAGGAELVNEELAKRLAQGGHEVVFLVGGFKGCKPWVERDGFTVVRVGGRYSVYWQAYKYYKKHLTTWPDLVIEEVNTVPFFTKTYVNQKNIILCYQLCREIWFYQMRFPISLIGYLLEPIYLRYLNDKFVLTESESTKRDLQRFGFKKDKIQVFPVGLETKPISETEFINQKKDKDPTIAFLGSIRDMKRPDQVLKAFEIAKQNIPNLKFFVIGSGDTPYAKKFFKKITASKHVDDISCFGRVNEDEKQRLLKKVHLICVASVKEGWGLVVTEANSQGTPAVVYNVDGLRDAVQNGVTGIVTASNTPTAMADSILKLLGDPTHYESLRQKAWEWSKEITFEKSYKQFADILNHA